MKIPRSIFGKRLREARLVAGISQKKLGILMGMDESVASARMNQYEVGTHSPNYDTAKSIADVLKVPVPYFYAEEDGLAQIILGLGKLGSEGLSKIQSSVNQLLLEHDSTA